MRKLALIATFCLTCVTGTAWALGLGEIEVSSSLNQPLQAEIPLFAIKPGEMGEIKAQVAPASAFERIGIERSPVLTELQFKVIEGSTPDRGVLRLSTLQSVREPFLSMLIEVSWSGGRIVREFTVLLDPPVLQSGTRPSASASAPARRYDLPGTEGTASRAYDQPPRGTAAGSSYGPVREQETLWSIAYAKRPNDSIPMDQMMQAIYDANPDAFDGSLSSIRAGSMLRIPSEAEIRATPPGESRRATRQARRPSPSPAQAPEPAATPPAQAAPESPAVQQPEPKGELRLSPPAESAAGTNAPANTQGDDASSGVTAPVVAPAPEAAAPATSTGPIEIRDNSAKAIELLSSHAREHAARQVASDQLTAETSKASAPTETPTAEPSKPADPVEVATPAAPSQPPATPAAPSSPFVDEPAAEAAPPVATGQESAATPAAPAEEAPPAPSDAVDTPAAPADAPVDSQVDSVDSSLPAAGEEEGFNPLLLAAAAVVLLALVLGASHLRKVRAARSRVELAPIVLADVPDQEQAEPLFSDTLETKAPPPKPAQTPGLSDTLRTKPETPAERTLESTTRSTLPPEQTTKQFMAVSTPVPDMPVAVESASGMANDPYADALGEVDIHIAYGLYDEAARLLQEPLAKSPERKDLHLKLLEVYFSANMTSEFEAQAKKMKAITSGPNDPDWEKACIMGQQLCPESGLFGGSGSGIGATADLDISSMLADAKQQAPAPAKPSAAPAAASPAAPSLDLDLSGFDLGVTAEPSPPKPAPAAAKPAAKPEPATQSDNTLDFNLDDFKLETPAASKPAASTKPAAAAAPSPGADADTSLDIDLSDFDLGEPSASGQSSAAGQAADMQELDDLLGVDQPVGEGQTDTRLDLARAYIDMGEPTMAQTLLQEVIAQGSAAQKQEAEELLGRLGST